MSVSAAATLGLAPRRSVASAVDGDDTAAAATAAAGTPVAAAAGAMAAATSQAMTDGRAGTAGATSASGKHGATASLSQPRSALLVSQLAPTSGGSGGGRAARAVASASPSHVVPDAIATTPPPLPLAPWGLRALVVDDEHVNRRLLARMLAVSGVSDVAQADDGTTALAAWRDARRDARPFDIVFSDIVMVLMHGDAMLAEMLAEGAADEVIAIACTGNAGPADVDRYLRCGFARVLCKPFSSDDVREAAAQVLPLVQRARERRRQRQQQQQESQEVLAQAHLQGAPEVHRRDPGGGDGGLQV